MKKRLSLFWYSIIFFGIIIIDRLTKGWALTLPENGSKINQFLSFDLVFNRGISWGLFNSYNTITFIAVSSLIIIVMCVLAFHAFITYKNEQLIVGHVLALAGALSNVVDRFMFGGVIDFIILSIGRWSWPVFNIADVAVVCGVFIMLLWHKND